MSKTAMAVMPKKEKKKADNGIPQYYRERLSDTTIGKFKGRIERILTALDEYDEEKPVRQLLEQDSRESRISCWTGECFINFSFCKERGE